jgi:molybdate transport system substrate-binding protein
MKRNHLTIIVFALLIALASLAGCGSGSGKTAPENDQAATEDQAAQDDQTAQEEPPAQEEESAGVTGAVMIAAAASLENAFEGELKPLFNETYPDITITGTYDSSGKLQEQIEGGLEADIFFSAALKQMDALVAGDFIDAASVTNLLLNEVVLITSPQSETKVTSFENIADAKTVAIGDPASVPAGQYAQEVLTTLGVWDKVESTASMGTNVTEVLNWVAEGSAEVGIVYATDAASMPDKVKVLSVASPETMQTPVVYPVAELKRVSDENKAATDAFIEFIKSPEAMSIFESYGFKPYEG